MDEQSYLDLVKEILDIGEYRADRTGTGTWSVFGRQLRFDLEKGNMPLLSTKRVWFKGVKEELFWMLSGSTDAKKLSERGVKIWDGNTTREFLDQRGLHNYVEGDLGPGYGFQWRHWGAKYNGCDADYAGQGVDQIAKIIEQLKTDPYSRRILLCAWNVADLDSMALPPCHVLAQFYVSKNMKLSCHLYQRSCDMGLGVPFNIASYSLLTHLLAKVCDLQPKELVYSLGDAHIYATHKRVLEEQIKRTPGVFPKIGLPSKHSIDEYLPEDVELVGYKPQGNLKMDMAV